jgi:Na+/melibiose symporter-like transporter
VSAPEAVKDGRIEVSSLPSGSPSLDLSAGKAPDVTGLLAQDIKDRERLRSFRTVAFYGAVALIFFVFCALFHWVNLVGDHMRDNMSSTTKVSFFVAPIVVLATLGALLTLALLKLAFLASTDKKDDDPSFFTLLQGLGTQAIELMKAYLGKKGE